ncbi:VWA domain-containing protein [Treponema sp. HNW]|uniref:VWA domain-containing protein n=1 Tax=Treponema sp. HNW TaxID=3116654 RepID=UPI003D0E85D7
MFEKTEALFLLCALPPALLYSLISIRKAAVVARATGTGRSLIRRLYGRTILWAGAWFCAVCALAGPSWGTKDVPVQRSGSAVCFVFDISYSMTAVDASEKEKLSRLELSQRIALNLLNRFKGTAVAAVLAKGDGVLALPLTEDYHAAENLIGMLSPAMLSAPGSSISSGIERAIEAFPPQSARNSTVIVFTDGDETEGSIERACEKAERFGIGIVLIGTGNEKEIEIPAGDGKTRVKTALHSSKLKKAADKENVFYIDAANKEVSNFVLQLIEPALFSSAQKKVSAGTAYEMQKQKHHGAFLLVSLLFFIAGFALAYASPLPKRLLPHFLLCLSLLFGGCSSWNTEKGAVLLGSYRWARHDYQKATAAFLTASQRARELHNRELGAYAVYGLASSYLMQDETEAALGKLNEVPPNSVPDLLFAVSYNKGIIAYRAGNFPLAASCFKNALLIKPADTDAKINFELCLTQEALKSKPAASERTPADVQNAPPGAEDTVFSLMRENDQKRWKNMYTEPASSGKPDF